MENQLSRGPFQTSSQRRTGVRLLSKNIPTLFIIIIFNQPFRHPQSNPTTPCTHSLPATSSPCIPKYPHRLQCIVYAHGTSSQKGILSSIGSNIATIFNLARNDLRMTSFVLDGTLPNHCLKSLTTSVLILALV